MFEGLFSCQRHEKSAEGLRGTANLSVGPGQSLCGEPGGKAPRNLTYLSFESLLLELKISHILLMIA